MPTLDPDDLAGQAAGCDLAQAGADLAKRLQVELTAIELRVVVVALLLLLVGAFEQIEQKAPMPPDARKLLEDLNSVLATILLHEIDPRPPALH
jgi:hypothetical protein